MSLRIKKNKKQKRNISAPPTTDQIVNKLHDAVNILIFRNCYGQLRSVSKDLFEREKNISVNVI